MATQTLEDFISEKFTALKLEIPSDDVEYIARLVEEEELEEIDKKEGVKGMVEGFMSEDMLNHEEHNDQELSQIDRAIEQVLVYWQDLRSARIAEESAVAEARQANSSGDDSSDPESETEGDAAEMSKGQKARKALLDSLTPEELAAAQKRALLAQYGYVEEEGYDAGDSGMAGSTLRKREEEKETADRRALIDKAIKEEGKRKRKGKRARQQGRYLEQNVNSYREAVSHFSRQRLFSVDLMAPNLNKAKVQVKAQISRDSAKAEANFKKDRDRAALEKQRADQAKAKADKQKKAQKGERRA
ncbi:hypothetical protein QFC21_004305 [Naganishia friedmannii]|uniref:Uncharacterized protein n=1 Tax=Naganishia friedmannii TaxID=89922 RepID=A0ACC2VJD6_9TREE|nr:hypothetical protein QFC21_004305 [Naganishia friedmannii]